MITKEDIEQVKKLAGKNMPVKFHQFLISNEILNSKGKDFSPSACRNFIYNRSQSNLEEPFLKFWNYLIKQHELRKETKQKTKAYEAHA